MIHTPGAAEIAPQTTTFDLRASRGPRDRTTGTARARRRGFARPAAALALLVLVLTTLTALNAGAAYAAVTSVVGSREWAGGSGVAVCYPSTPAPCLDRSTGSAVTPSESASFGWQCAELAVRFWDTMGWESGWFGGNGVDFYTWGLNHPGVATVYPNGHIASPPVHGDLISVSDGASTPEPGHVVVVDYVDNTGVHVMEQNNSATGRATYKLTAGTLSRQYDLRTILGVVHANANHNTATPLSGGAVDVLVNGNFRGTTAPWLAQVGANLVVVSGSPYGTVPYDGTSYAATNAPQPGGAIYEQIPMTITTGQDYCASLQVVTQGTATGGSGTLAVSLMGGAATDATNTALTGLGNGSNWKGFTGCVTATGTHTSLVVAIYPTVGAPTLALDAVQAS